MRAAQRAKFAEKVHKPPLWVNVINFELNGLDASIWVPWSPSDPKKSWCTDRSIQIHKKQAAFLHLYRVARRLRFTLKFVNLFVDVSRVCGMSCVGGQGQVCIEIMENCKIVYGFKNCLCFKFCKFCPILLIGEILNTNN